MSAQIISLCERRSTLGDVPVVDLITAVDVAIRDLRDIAILCDSEEARQRAEECRRILVLALAAT